MRIRRISAEGLFGLFDHSIPLNLDERLTIIHGANGLGKTALLRLLNGFFNSKYSELEAIPFLDFEIDFDNSSHVHVHKPLEKSKGDSVSKEAGLFFTYFPETGSQEKYHFNPERSPKSTALRRHVGDLDDFVPDLERIGVDLWRYLPTGEPFSFYEALARFSNFLPASYREILEQADAHPEWLTKLKNSIDVHFIQSQRLVTFNERRPRHVGIESPVVTPVVQVYSEEITRAIKNTLAEYADLSQSLDRTFPERLVQQNRVQELSSDELRDRLAALERKRQGLQAAGLLEEEQGVRFEMPEHLDATRQNVLSVYVKDVERKLGVFDAIAAKIDLLKQIVDERFLYKRMMIHREKGFLFTNEGGQPLSPTHLSSGEQNELVLLYELLFKVKPGSLILIDEPEISLHVAWQQQFLKDLQQIIRLSEFDVLIATHSPQIVHDRWDLTVELQGPPERKK